MDIERTNNSRRSPLVPLEVTSPTGTTGTKKQRSCLVPIKYRPVKRPRGFATINVGAASSDTPEGAKQRCSASFYRGEGTTGNYHLCHPTGEGAAALEEAAKVRQYNVNDKTTGPTPVPNVAPAPVNDEAADATNTPATSGNSPANERATLRNPLAPSPVALAMARDPILIEKARAFSLSGTSAKAIRKGTNQKPLSPSPSMHSSTRSPEEEARIWAEARFFALSGIPAKQLDNIGSDAAARIEKASEVILPTGNQNSGLRHTEDVAISESTTNDGLLADGLLARVVDLDSGFRKSDLKKAGSDENNLRLANILAMVNQNGSESTTNGGLLADSLLAGVVDLELAFPKLGLIWAGLSAKQQQIVTALLSTQQRRIDSVKLQVQQRDSLIRHKDKIIKQKDKVIKQKDEAIRRKDKAIKQKDEAIKRKDWAIDEAIKRKDEAVRTIDEAISRKDEAIEAINRKDEAIEAISQKKDTIIKHKDKIIKQKDKVIKQKDEVIKRKGWAIDKVIKQKDEVIKRKDWAIDKAIKRKDEAIRAIDEAVKRKDAELAIYRIEKRYLVQTCENRPKSLRNNQGNEPHLSQESVTINGVNTPPTPNGQAHITTEQNNEEICQASKAATLESSKLCKEKSQETATVESPKAGFPSTAVVQEGNAPSGEGNLDRAKSNLESIFQGEHIGSIMGDVTAEFRSFFTERGVTEETADIMIQPHYSMKQGDSGRNKIIISVNSYPLLGEEPRIDTRNPSMAFVHDIFDGEHHIHISMFPFALKYTEGTDKLKLGDKDSLVKYFGQEIADLVMEKIGSVANWVAITAPEYEVYVLLMGHAARSLVEADVFDMSVVKSVEEVNHSSCVVNARDIDTETKTKDQYADYLRLLGLHDNDDAYWRVVLSREKTHRHSRGQKFDNAVKKSKQEKYCSKIVDVLSNN